MTSEVLSWRAAPPSMNGSVPTKIRTSTLADFSWSDVSPQALVALPGALETDCRLTSFVHTLPSNCDCPGITIDCWVASSFMPGGIGNIWEASFYLQGRLGSVFGSVGVSRARMRGSEIGGGFLLPPPRQNSTGGFGSGGLSVLRIVAYFRLADRLRRPESPPSETCSGHVATIPAR